MMESGGVPVIELFRFGMPVAMALITGGLGLLWRGIRKNETEISSVADKQHKTDLKLADEFVKREEYNRDMLELKEELKEHRKMLADIGQNLAGLRESVEKHYGSK